MEEIRVHMGEDASVDDGVWPQHATRVFFFIAGFGVAAWAPLVPFVKARLGLGEDLLGMLLLCLGVGSVLTMPIAGALAARFGCRAVLAVSGAAMPAFLILLSFLDSLPLVVVTLFLFGAAMGTLDAVVNIHAVFVEKASGRRLMSGLHGLWSVGGFAGAGLFGLMMHWGMPLTGVSVCVALIVWGAVALFARHLLPYGGQNGGSPIALPKGIVAFIGALCFISFLAEGAILDWSGVFLTSLRGMEMSSAGFGYAMFSAAMLICRLGGDRIVQKLGERIAVAGGGLTAAAGFLLTILADGAYASLAGFFMVGAGAANIVPVLYSLLGKQSVMPINTAVSAVTTIGYTGILMGPAAIGFVAHQFGLLTAFGLLAALLFLQALAARYIYARMSA